MYKTWTEHHGLGIKHEERYKIPSDHGASKEWYLSAINVTWSPKMAGIGQVVLEVRTGIVSYINSSFLAKFRFPVTREDVTLLKTFTIPCSAK